MIAVNLGLTDPRRGTAIGGSARKLLIKFTLEKFGLKTVYKSLLLMFSNTYNTFYLQNKLYECISNFFGKMLIQNLLYLCYYAVCPLTSTICCVHYSS